MRAGGAGKRVFFYAVLALVAYGLVEIAASVAYLAVERKAPSFDGFRAEREAAIAAGAAASTREVGTLGIAPGVFEVLHPYLGYVDDPTRGAGFSELGFPDGDVKLYAPDANRVVIGIFGGSFADGLVRSAKDVLAAALRDSPRFANKDIKVVGIATGGYKQPQQLMALAWMLSLGAHFDYVVTLDGFNEVVLPPLDNVAKGVSPYYPRNWAGRLTAYDAQMLAMAADHAQMQRGRAAWARFFSRAPMRFSITASALWEARDRLFQRRIHELNEAALAYRPDPTHTPYAVRGPRFAYASDAAMYEDLARLWKDASLQMNAMARGNGIGYLQFLQPNQYVPGSKPIGEQERKAAIQDDHPYRASVLAGYPVLRRQGAELARRGVDFTDLTLSLAGHGEPLYTDTCCHLSPEGYAIVARVIAERIVAHR